MIFKGYIKEILTQKENDWGRYRTEDSSGAIKLVVGVIPFAAYGMYIEVEGEDSVTKWGPQFTLKKVLHTELSDLSGVTTFLCDYVKYVGPAKAQKITKLFGKGSLEMFNTADGQQKLIEKKCFTKQGLERSMNSYNKYKQYIPLVLFFKGATTKNQVKKIYDKYDGAENAIKKIKRNPYCLYDDVAGFGFKKADALALSINVKATSKYRIQAGMTYILDDAGETDGDCYLDYETLKDRCLILLGAMPKFSDISERVAENAASQWSSERKEKLIKTYDPSAETIQGIEETVQTRQYIYDCFRQVFDDAVSEGRLVNDGGHIYTKYMYNREVKTAERFAEMAKEKPTFTISASQIEKVIRNVETEKNHEFTAAGMKADFAIENEQKDAIINGLTHRISIMTGGPGTGKTTTIETIAKGFIASEQRKEDVLMLAPTGRAAQRIKEQTGYEASTIHRAIFSYRNGKPVLKEAPENKLIICDEFSMVDIYLAASLSEFCRDSNLVIVGDVDQIASVGAGKVLKDLIASEVIPTTFLALGHRNVGSIARNAKLINNGVRIKEYEYDEHFHYTGIQDTSTMLTVVINDYIRNVNKYGIKEVMLAAAMRQRGPCCVDKLNSALQQIFTGRNDRIKFNASREFALGDRVMQTKNDYGFRRLYDGENVEEGVFNGEKGTVAKVIHGSSDGGDDRILVKFDDGSVGGYDKGNIMNLVLAYATTLHKCQGSEAKCMMMTYVFGDYMLLRRSLFYTGETRAKEEFYFYGEEKDYYGTKNYSAFDTAVKKLDDKERNTGLARRLKEARTEIRGKRN